MLPIPTSRVKTNLFLTFEIATKWQNVGYKRQSYALADLGGMPGACPPPLWDPILLFSHTFSPKSTHIGGPHPPHNGCTPPLTGNPGSATAMV